MPIYKNYKYKPNYLSGVTPDQTVILKKRFLRYLPGVRRLNYLEEQQHQTVPEEWYPMVNSFYPFTEDVDAFARVDHLIASKRSLDSVDREIAYSNKNEYSEKEAFRQYLRSKPISFLILGKPGLGEEDLGRRLANYWKCVYIDPLVLLEEEIASCSRVGQCIDFNLRCGRAIGTDVLTRLLSRKVQSPEVLNRGFVCCGFPLIPNDLYEEDPISSESAVFNVKEIFDEIIDQTIRIIDPSGKVEVSMIDSKDVSESEHTLKHSQSDSLPNLETSELKMTIEWSIMDDPICGPGDISADLEKQLNIVFGLFSHPYMILYIHCKNSDVISKRDNYFFDIYSQSNVDMTKINLFYEIGASNEALTADLFDEGRNPFAENPTLKHLVKVPENMPGHVATQLDRYHNCLANLIDCRVILHERQYYVKLDGRAFLTEMMAIIKQRLKFLPLQKVIIPERFVDNVYEDLGETDQVQDPEVFTVEEAFYKFSRSKTVSPMFPWTWSDWGTLCPVSMSEHANQTGSPNFAVHCFDKIFFLANERTLESFVKNPRPYLLPPFPKPGAKVFIFGPPCSGKTAVAQCLGYLLNSKVLTPDQMQKQYFDQVVDEYKDKVRQAAIAEALEVLKERHSNEVAERKEQREKEIEVWAEESKKLLTQLQTFLDDVNKHSFVLSSFPVKVEEEEFDRRSLNEGEILRQRLMDRNFPYIRDLDHCNKMLEDEETFYQNLPDRFKSEITEEPANVWDPFVLEYVDSKVEAIKLDEIKTEDEENVYEVYIRGIRATEEQAEVDGWVIDGMTTDLALLKQICEEFSVDNVIILHCSDNKFLSKRFSTGQRQDLQYRGFRSFFLSIGERDAAWRSPSVTSTQSYKEEIAKDILSDVLKFDFEEDTIQQEKLEATRLYEEQLKSYDEEIKNVQELFQQLHIHVTSVDVKDLPLEELLKQVTNLLQDKYRRTASEFTQEDCAEEIQQFLAQAAPIGEGETKDTGLEDFLAKYRQWGDTYHYCPVSFSEKFVLRRGKEEFAVKFKAKIYYLANEANFNKFLQCPRRYLSQESPPEALPPPRICILGIGDELRKLIAQNLARNVGVRYLDYKILKREAVDRFSSMSLMVESSADLSEGFLHNWYDSLFEKIFEEESIKYYGFVLESFPIKPSDLEYMIKRDAIPDVIMCLTMNREEHLKREIQSVLERKRQEMEEIRKQEEIMKMLIFQEWEERRKNRYNELMEMKRQQRYSKKIGKGNGDGNISPIAEDDLVFASDTQISVDSVVEQQEHEETMKILEEELPEPVFSISQEPEDEFSSRQTEEMEQKYDEFMEDFFEIKKICDRELIQCVEIDASQDFAKILRHTFILANECKFRGRSFFECCYEVPLDVAEKLLSCGYFLTSTYGRHCPVQYYQGKNPLIMYEAYKENNVLYPVIHRKYIYFLGGKKARDLFLKNPLKYTTVSHVNIAAIPVCVAIIGPPKSGKTTLADRFHRGFGFKRVSRTEAIRYTLAHPLYNNLKISLEEVLRKGEVLTDELIMDCVEVATFCGEGSVSPGIVFDGFPCSIEEMKALSRLGLVPHLIFDLQIPKERIFEFTSYPSTNEGLSFSQRFIEHLLTEWQKKQEVFRVWCDREYQNIYKLPVDRSIWGVWDHAKEVTLSVSFERKHYHKHAKHDWPLRLAYMLVTPLEFLQRQSGYKTFCPGCLYYSHKLKNGGDPPDRTGLIHFEKYFYWLCEEHIEEFLVSPEKFVPPSNVSLPSELPVVLNLTEMPEKAHEDGYCMSCYRKNFPKKVLNKGSIQHAVLYRDKIYLFDSSECLSDFMATPEKFCRLTINFKEDCYTKSLGYKDLPVIGMLEQYVARRVVRAVNHTNVNRPVIPGLSIAQAALICVGLNLKVYNPGTPTAYIAKYKEALDLFHQRHSNLIKYLEWMKKYKNPAVHYDEPDTPVSTEGSEEEDDWEPAVYSSMI